MGDHQFGKSTEREAVHAGTKALLDGSDRTFDLTNMTVGGYNVHCNRADVLTDAREFIVGVNVADSEASGTVEVDDG